ncbi:hypothetical protein C4D60_Mb10t21960 [Musa balbisiana]|uniref:Uncharacterized protein n=1 Tax=Musa balbisiana TaxID=52838 RepID=A0A4S8IYT8_MUSBA|nr:hypothetical protein C4D60_Mb10t21960 [Musa balbisiana]
MEEGEVGGSTTRRRGSGEEKEVRPTSLLLEHHHLHLHLKGFLIQDLKRLEQSANTTHQPGPSIIRRDTRQTISHPSELRIDFILTF